jgi:hypothetical protein
MRLNTFAIAAALSAGLSVGAGVASAQQPTSDQVVAARACMASVMQSLNLSDDQKSQIEQIRNSNQSPEDKRTAIHNVLTPDQQQTMAAGAQKCRTQQ